MKKKNNNSNGLTFIEDDEDLPKNVVKIKKRNRILSTKTFAVLSIFLVTSIAVIAFWGNISPTAIVEYIQNLTGNYGENKFPVAYSQGNFKDAAAMGNYIDVLTDTSFILYSSSGKELAVRQHGFLNPQIISSVNKAVIYSEGGKEYKVETRFNEANDATMNYPITTASVNNSGYYAIVTSSHDYLSELTVFDNDNKNVFKWYCSQGRIISCSLSPDNTHVATIVLTSDNGDIKSDIIIYDLNSKNPISDNSYSGLLLFSLQYKDKNSISAIGDKEAIFLDGNGNKRSVYSYSDKTLKCYYNNNGGTSLAFSRYGIGKETTVVSLDNNGGLIGQKNIDTEVRKLCADNDYIVAFTTAGIDYYSSDYKNGGTLSTTGDILKTLCIKNNVYIFTPGTVYHSTLK